MGRARTVAKNSFYLILDRLIRGLLLMILTIWVARVLGVKHFGIYSLALVLAGIFRLVSDFGITFLTTHEVAKDRTRVSHLFVHGLVVKSIMAFAGFVLFIIGRFK